MSDIAIHDEKTCQVCAKAKPVLDSVAARMVRPPLQPLLLQRAPAWSAESYICVPCLNDVRNEYVRTEMERERGEIGAIEAEVLDSLHKGESVVEDMNREFDAHLTVGERLADKVAEFGGSWKFIIIFFACLGVWMAINVIVLTTRAFDPYPFILLNLMLSLVASIQAPIIMMSQNRSGIRDRMQAEGDYKTNLKAEIEVRAINEKLDQLLHNQWARLLEIQQLQMDMLNDLAERRVN